MNIPSNFKLTGEYRLATNKDWYASLSINVNVLEIVAMRDSKGTTVPVWILKEKDI
jgi:hypothetical protein